MNPNIVELRGGPHDGGRVHIVTSYLPHLIYMTVPNEDGFQPYSREPSAEKFRSCYRLQNGRYVFSHYVTASRTDDRGRRG